MVISELVVRSIAGNGEFPATLQILAERAFWFGQGPRTSIRHDLVSDAPGLALSVLFEPLYLTQCSYYSLRLESLVVKLERERWLARFRYNIIYIDTIGRKCILHDDTQL